MDVQLFPSGSMPRPRFAAERHDMVLGRELSEVGSGAEEEDPERSNNGPRTSPRKLKATYACAQPSLACARAAEKAHACCARTSLSLSLSQRAAGTRSCSSTLPRRV